MATQAQPKVSATVRNEAFVEEQLAKARFRIRILDVSASILGFFILTFLFALAAVVADRYTGGLAASTRQLAFAVYLLASLAFLGLTLVWPLLRPVNPYYAARKVEQ